MNKTEAIQILKKTYKDYKYDRIAETNRYYIFSFNDPRYIAEPVYVDKMTKKCAPYNPVRDGV